MKSRVHPKYKTKYRVGNWRAYERALVQRGDVTLWLSADKRAAWRPAPSGQPGGQKRFSDLAIKTALTLRLVFRLPLRQAEGFLRSVLSMMDVPLEAPDHTTLSRRSRHLDVELRRVPAKGPIHLIVDSTGLSIGGEGEWAATKHNGRGQRGWKKLHLGVDRSGVIVAHTLTEATGGRRRLVIIGRPGWRTPSSGTSRSSGMPFEPVRPKGKRPKSVASNPTRGPRPARKPAPA
jgi:Transposase DDE domain